MRYALRYATRLFAAVLFTTSQMPVWAETPAAAATEAPPTDQQLATEEARARVGGRLTVGGRIGDLGFRALCPKVDAIAGLNLFYDSRRTAHDNTFDQVGAGVEVLSAWVDARANYYWPDDKQEMIDRQSDTEVDRYVDHSYSDLYAEGHQILQLEKIKTTTITTTRFFERFEAALEGYDLELGFRLPYLPDWLETRVFAGYYAFEGDFTEDIDGVKGRLEIRALPILTLDAEIYEDDALAGSDYFVGARVNVPFDLANLAQGKNPFAGTSEQVKAARRTFRDRLNEMVIRDPHVRLHESGFIENEGLKQVDTDIDRDENELVILDDVNFVNNKNTGFENGTDEHPYNTVQEGVDNVFGDKNVYVYKGIKSYRENVRIEEDGVSLLGEGCAIEGFGGEKFGGGKFPVLNGNVGGVNGPVVRVNSDNVLIKGFEITRSAGGANPGAVDALGVGLPIDRVGILGENADNLLIACNRINNQSVGILGIYDPTEPGAPQDYHIRITDNTIADSPMGVQLHSIGAGAGRFTARVDDNVFEDGAIFALQATLSGLSDADLAITGNTFRNPSAFVFATVIGITNDASIRITDNVFERGAQIVTIAGQTGRDLDIDISQNRILADGAPSFLQAIFVGPVGRDLSLHMDKNYVENGTSLLTLTPVLRNADISFSGNTFVNSGGGALTLIGSTVDGNAVLRFDNNTIANPVGSGILAILPPVVGNDLYVSASGNRITGAVGAGILLTGVALMNNAYVSMHNNQILNNAGAGLTATFGAATGNVVVSTSGNRINDNTGSGMTLLLGAVSGNADISVLNSEFNGNAGAGLTVSAPSVGGTLNVVVDPTSANGNSGDGMILTLASTGDLSLLLEDVTANENGGSGLILSASSSGSVQAAFLDVEASRNGVGGLTANLSANRDLILGRIAPVPEGNRITANGNTGGYGVSISGSSISGAVVSLTERMQTSTNIGGGSFRDLQAAENVNVVDGEVEANNNLGQGMVLTAESTNAAAIYQVGRLVANGNIGGGAALTLVARATATAFLGLESPISLLPPTAQNALVLNNNIGGGLTAILVSEEGGAGGVLGRTEASGNIGNGLSFNVIAEEQAALFLGLADGSLTNGTSPVVANSNAGNGISVNMFSASDNAMLLLLGDGSANNNLGSGVQANLNAASEVIMGIGSAPFGGGAGSLGAFEASGNQQVGVGLFGVSTGSSVQVILAGIAANSNVLDGINVEAHGLDGVQVVAGSYLDTDSAIEALGNGGVGLRVTGTAPAGGALMLLSDVNASGNASNGVSVNLSGRDKITMVLGLGTDGGTNIFLLPVAANNNGASGIQLGANSSTGEVELAALSFIANSNASRGLDANLNAYSNVNVYVGDLGGLIPVTITGGSGQMTGNGQGGLLLAATSLAGSVTAEIGNMTVNNNAGPGAAADISLTAARDVTASLSDSEVNGNTSTFGLRLRHIAGSNAFVTLENVEASNNDGANFAQPLADAGGNSLLVVRNVTVTNNGGVGLVAHATAVGSATVIVENVVADDNFQGVDLYATSDDGDAVIRISNLVANANATVGVEGDAISGGSVARIQVEDVRADGNGTDGVDLRTEGFNAANARVDVTGDLSVDNNRTGALFVAKSAGTATVLFSLNFDVSAEDNANHGIIGAAEGDFGSVSLSAGFFPSVNNNGQYGLVALAVGTNGNFAGASNPSGTGNGSGNEHTDTSLTGPWESLLP
jgi:hypothetical protein